MNRPKNPPPRNHFGVRRGAPVSPTIQPVYHDRLAQQRDGVALRSGDIGLRVVLCESVHVGSGHFVLDTKGKAVKDTMRSLGVPVIPGSSIKGCCRQVYELLTRSQQGSGEPVGMSHRRTIEMHRRKGQALSPAAALFGCLGYEGRASFDDAVPVEKVSLERRTISTAYPPKKRIQGTYKFYGDLPREASQPRRIAAFAIPSGTTLATRLRLRNVSDGEISDLLLSLGVGRFTPRIGGAKYDALGRVSFEVRSYRLCQGLAGSTASSERVEDVNAFLFGLSQESDLASRAAKALEALEAELPPVRLRGSG